MYEIAVDKNQFDDLLANSTNEYHAANKESIRKLKSKKFTGTWISIFKKEINKYEGNEFSILGKIERINESVKRQDASWFSALAVCNESVDCKISYKLTIRNKPCVEEQGFYEVMVEKLGEHIHNIQKKQLRGE